MLSETFLSVCSLFKEVRIQLFIQHLKGYKPHIKINKTIYEQGINMEQTYIIEEHTYFEDLQNSQILLDVYDEQQKREKILKVYFVDSGYWQNNKDLIQSQINLTKAFSRKDLILNIYDSYFLPRSKDYFVIEFEKYDFNLKQFCQRFKIPENSFSDLVSKQSKQCYDLLNATKETSNFENLMPQFFVSIQSQSNIQVKLILIDPELEILSLDSIAKKTGRQFKNYQKGSSLDDRMEMEEEIKKEERSIPQFIEEKEELIFSMKSNTIRDLISNIDLTISNSDLVSIIQQRFSLLIEYHSIEIFEILSQHPHYSSFKMIHFDEHSFTFKIEKRESLILTCKKFQTIDQANLAQQTYEKLIKVSSNLYRRNVVNIEIIPLQNCCYLLIEKENPISTYQSVEHYILEDRDPEVANIQLLIIIIDLLYEVRKSSEFKLSQIHPSKLFVSDNVIYDHKPNSSSRVEKGETQNEEQSQCELIIDDSFTNEDYSVEYCSIIKILLQESLQVYVENSDPQQLDKILNFFQQFLANVFNSSCSVEEVMSQYDQTKKICFQLGKVKDTTCINIGFSNQLFKLFLQSKNLDQMLLKINVKIKPELEHFMRAYDIIQAHKEDIYCISINHYNIGPGFDKTYRLDNSFVQSISEYFSFFSNSELESIKIQLIAALSKLFGYYGVSIKIEDKTLLISPKKYQQICLKFMIQDDQQTLLLSGQQEENKVIDHSTNMEEIEQILFHYIVSQKFGKNDIQQSQCCRFQDIMNYSNLLLEKAYSTKVLNLTFGGKLCSSNQHFLHIQQHPQLIELKIEIYYMSEAQTINLVKQLNQQRNIIKVTINSQQQRRELYKLIKVVSLIQNRY